MNIISDPSRFIHRCRVCDSKDLEPVIDFGNQPWCGNFLKKEDIGKEPFYPLRLLYCHNCSTPQLDYTVPKEEMFSDHTYLSGLTKTMNRHFKAVAQDVDSRFFKNIKDKTILDIGSNDGAQLREYKALGYEVLGVEPAKSPARIANDSGIETLIEFFNLNCARRLNRKFDCINAGGVFFHLEELHSASEGIRAALKEDGVFVAQFLYMKCIVENTAFDQIYHEHLLYYNLKTIERLLNRHGLGLFDAYLVPIHGGLVIGFITHKGRRPPTQRLEVMRKSEYTEGSNDFSTYLEFAQRIERMKETNVAYIKENKSKDRRIFGFGAPAKGNTLLNYFGIGTEYVDYLVEKNQLRNGLYSPGMHIPIVIEDEFDKTPDIYYVLAWNFKKEILAKNKHLLGKGVEFYFPVNPEFL